MGRGGGHCWLPTTLCRNLILYLSLATIIVGTQGQLQACPANAELPVEATKSVTVNHCQGILVSPAVYNLWYNRDNSTSPTTLSVVLSVPNEPRWFAMGFNAEEDSMVKTSAIIFWLNPTSKAPYVHTYYLSAEAQSGVNVDNTRLKYKVPPSVVVTSSNLYLTYAVEEPQESSMAFQNFAVGQNGDTPPDSDTGFNGAQHELTQQSIAINFVTGSVALTTVDLSGKKKTHGILNIIGWGVLLPLGAIIARYARGFDPHWFYAHALFQIVGYGFVMAGLITGSNLLDKDKGVNADTHKSLAILIFVLATIQISAILLRPNTNHKLRRYWNWGHWWLGRIALVLAAVNIFVGIHLGRAGSRWKIGYGVVLGLELLLIIILEALLWLNYAKTKDEHSLPQTAMQQRQGPSVNGSGPTAPPAYEPTNWDGKP